MTDFLSLIQMIQRDQCFLKYSSTCFLLKNNSEIWKTLIEIAICALLLNPPCNFLTIFISLGYEYDRNSKCRKVYFLPKLYERFICPSFNIIHSGSSHLKRIKTLMMRRLFYFVFGNGRHMVLTWAVGGINGAPVGRCAIRKAAIITRQQKDK